MEKEINQEDVNKIEFIKTTVLVDNLHFNLNRIDMKALERTIEMVPDNAKSQSYYRILVYTLDFYKKVEKEMENE